MTRIPDQAAPGPFSLWQNVAALAAGTEIEATAAVSPAEAARIAESLGVAGISDLKAKFVLAKTGRKGHLKVSGRIEAFIEQTCVVCLEPVTERVVETVDRLFISTAKDQAKGAAIVEIDPEGDDPPDGYDGRSLDLGAILVEHLALATNPYPRHRKDGQTLCEPVAAADSDFADHPFAKLAALKGRNEERD